VPVGQNLPGDPLDDPVVDAFFQALSPVEWNAYAQAVAAQTQADERAQQVQRQPLERLRDEAALAQRQFDPVDPQNRLVAAELEYGWETALQRLQFAEAEVPRPSTTLTWLPIPAELRDVFSAIGQKLPLVWSPLAHEHQKAFWGCLIDKVVVQRTTPDHLQTRIVWRGGATTRLNVPVSVGAFTQLSDAQAMETLTLDLFHQGKTDEPIAQTLIDSGYRSPMRPDTVLPSTVRAIRLKHR
jgi:hypothetical protein